MDYIYTVDYITMVRGLQAMLSRVDKERLCLDHGGKVRTVRHATWTRVHTSGDGDLSCDLCKLLVSTVLRRVLGWKWSK